MSDSADLAAVLVDANVAAGLARISATIPAGVPGECDDCGETMPRLVDGRCAFCRDGRRPPLSTFERLPAASVPTREQEPVMPNPKYATKVISVPIESAGTVGRIERYATEHDLPLGRAAAELVVAGLETIAARAPAEADNGPEPVTVVSLETVPIEWLTDELIRRAGNRGEAEAAMQRADAAVTRAEAVEGQLATLRQQIRGLVGAEA
jgi:hypothetical protein